MPYDEKLACIASYSNSSPSLAIPIAVFLLVHWKISAQKCWYLSGMTGWMADWPLQLWFTTTHLCLTLMVLCRCLIRGDCHSNVYSFPYLLPKDFLLIFFSLCQICRLIVNFNCWSFLYQQLLFQCRLLRGFFSFMKTIPGCSFSNNTTISCSILCSLSCTTFLVETGD